MVVSSRLPATAKRRPGVARTALAALIVIVAATRAAAGAERLGDASADKIEATTAVPDEVRKVGEVRLVSRGDGVVVQTLLSTKLLSRVIAEIRLKEARNWPATDESVRSYLAALDAARETVEKRAPGLDWKDRRRRLLIEFAADATNAVVVVGTFTTVPGDSDLTPRERELFSTLVLPRAYVLREIRLILADSFKVAEQDVDRLGPLGPAATVAAAPSAAAGPGTTTSSAAAAETPVKKSPSGSVKKSPASPGAKAPAN